VVQDWSQDDWASWEGIVTTVNDAKLLRRERVIIMEMHGLAV
jgi:hypothetical protein